MAVGADVCMELVRQAEDKGMTESVEESEPMTVGGDVCMGVDWHAADKEITWKYVEDSGIGRGN